MVKTCFKCNRELPLDCFYKHNEMYDGHLNKCKECTKKDVRENRLNNIDYYRSYDRERGNRQTHNDLLCYRSKYPNKYNATNMVNNAVRDGKIFRQSCELCGNINSYAHHDDYLKPLNVRWLCPVHHKKWHSEYGEGLNG